MSRGIAVFAVTASLFACSFHGPGGGGDAPPELGEPDLDAMPGDAPPAPAPDAGDAGDGDASMQPDSDAEGGDPGDDGRPGDDDSSTPLPPPDPPSDDGGGGTDGGGDEGSVADDGGSEESGGEAACTEMVVDLLWAADADVTAPMELGTATQAIDQPNVALSSVAEEGEVTFELDLPCAGDYYVYGLVWDYTPGAWADPDADSFYVGVGGPDELVWRYGCQTAGQGGALSWQPLHKLEDQPCVTTPIVLQAPAPGEYTLTLRNREAGSGSAVAGVAAIAITNDPTVDPYDQYAPY